MADRRKSRFRHPLRSVSHGRPLEKDEHEQEPTRAAKPSAESSSNASPSEPTSDPGHGLRLLDRVRRALRTRHYSPETEKAYVAWIKRFVFFNDTRHPNDMGEAEVSAYISHLATRRKVSASTQSQALSALMFLYQKVLDRELDLMEIVRAKRPEHLPVIMSRSEVRAVLDRLEGVHRLMAALMYGSGLRVTECCRLRVKDIDFERRELTVRNGKGEKDRVTVLPERLIEPLIRHLERVRRQHQRDLERGTGRVELPYALARKYPNAAREWGWQWLFPATRHYVDRETGERRRHFLHKTVLTVRRT